MTPTTTERDEAREALRDLLPPGATVYTVLGHVSASGMTRWLDLYYLDGEPYGDRAEPRRITWQVARACGYTYDRRREALKVGGCGMDMGFAVVYDLAAVLWPKGAPCTGEDCPSNSHSNDPRGPRGEGVTHADGGYTLRQRWL